MDSAVPDQTKPRRCNWQRLLFSSPLFLIVRGILLVEDEVNGVRVMAVVFQRGRHTPLLNKNGISNYCGVAKDVVVFALRKTHNKWHHRPLLEKKKKKMDGKREKYKKKKPQKKKKKTRLLLDAVVRPIGNWRHCNPYFDSILSIPQTSLCSRSTFFTSIPAFSYKCTRRR
ncbi:hypothetical protein TCDM_06999 [Trypanosoma cruzi Dm28c]|uniref:Uncharacterized protein n=1 Tax=Trypanosoma cruzi Dm28c TaxID=1416333 RepID=V5DBH2_TRYCR|nr:hypothetical protein TCDM_06999 [Trypanosoma cruzi Dm28c]